MLDYCSHTSVSRRAKVGHESMFVSPYYHGGMFGDHLITWDLETLQSLFLCENGQSFTRKMEIVIFYMRVQGLVAL